VGAIYCYSIMKSHEYQFWRCWRCGCAHHVASYETKTIAVRRCIFMLYRMRNRTHISLFTTRVARQFPRTCTFLMWLRAGSRLRFNDFGGNINVGQDNQYLAKDGTTEYGSTMAMSSSVSTATITPRSSNKVDDSMNDTPEQEQVSPPGDGGADYDHFFWTYTEEPHRTRRQAIIKAHPEVCTSSIHREAEPLANITLIRFSSSAAPSP